MSAATVQRRVRQGSWTTAPPGGLPGRRPPSRPTRHACGRAWLWAGENAAAVSGPAAGVLARPDRPSTRGDRGDESRAVSAATGTRPGVRVRRRALLRQKSGTRWGSGRAAACASWNADPRGRATRRLEHGERHGGDPDAPRVDQRRRACRSRRRTVRPRLGSWLAAVRHRQLDRPPTPRSSGSGAQSSATPASRHAVLGHPFGPWRVASRISPRRRLPVEVDGWAWHVDCRERSAVPDRFASPTRLVRAG